MSVDILLCPDWLFIYTLKECQNRDAEKRCATCDSTSHHLSVSLRRRPSSSKYLIHAKALTAAKNKFEGKPSAAPKVSMTTPGSAQDKQAESQPQEPAQVKKTKRKKAKVTAEVSEKPSEPTLMSEDVQMHKSLQLFSPK